MTITAILDRIRGNRQQAVMTAAESYYHLLKDVATGNEVDAGDAALVIEQAEKSDSDFERDVKVMVNRITAAERLRERKDCERQLAQAEADAAAAQAKLDAALAKLRPPIIEAADRMRHLTQAVLNRSTTENDLIQTVLNPAIIKREAEIVPRIRELAAKIEPVQKDHNLYSSMLITLRTNLEVLQRNQAIETWHTSRQLGIKNDIESCKEREQETADTVRQIEAILKPLQNELAEIQKEQAELHLQKLVP